LTRKVFISQRLGWFIEKIGDKPEETGEAVISQIGTQKARAFVGALAFDTSQRVLPSLFVHRAVLCDTLRWMSFFHSAYQFYKRFTVATLDEQRVEGIHDGDSAPVP
jgi:hypothetical protein